MRSLSQISRDVPRRYLSMNNSGRPRTDRRSDMNPPATAEEAAANQAGVAKLLDSHGGAGALRTGRAWRASELRLKSFDDLHKLWHVLLKERTILLSEREWCRTNRRYWENGASNLYKVKRSMARLQSVVGERARAYKKRRALIDARTISREGLSAFNSPEETTGVTINATVKNTSS